MLCILFAGAVAIAQDGTPLAELTKEAIVKSAEDKAAVRVALDENRNTLVEQFGTRSEEVRTATVEVQAIDLPDAPQRPEGRLSVEDAQAAVDLWTQRLEFTERLIDLNNALAAASRARRETALLLAQEADLLAAWLSDTGALRQELTRRIESGDVTAEEIPEIFAVEAAASAEPTTEEWRQDALRDRLAAETAEATAATLGESILDIRDGLSRSRTDLANANLDAAIGLEIEPLGLADLQAAYAETQSDIAGLREVVEERRAAYREAQTSFDTARMAFDQVGTGGDADQAAGDGATGAAFASLRAAEQALAAAEQRVSLEGQRREALDTIRAALTALTDAETAYLDPLQRYGEANARAYALAARIVAEGGTAEDPPEEMAIVDDRREVFDVTRAQATREGAMESVDDRIVGVETAQAEAADAVESRARALEREREWAQFLEEAEGMETAGLIDNFNELLDTLDEDRETARDFASAADTALEALTAARTEVENHYNPIGVATGDDAVDSPFAAWRGSVGLAERVTEDAVVDEGNGTDASAATVETGGDEAAPVVTPYERELTSSRARLDEVSKWLDYYANDVALRTAYQESLEQAIRAIDREINAQQDTLALTRQVWGAAAVLRQRQEAGEQLPARTVTGIEAWASRERVITLQDNVSATEDQKDGLSAEQAALGQGPMPDQFIHPLDGLKANMVQQIEALVSVTNFEEQFQSLESLDNLDEIQRRLITKEIIARLEADHGVYAYLDDFFASEQLTDIDDLLRRYYERYILLERQLSALTDQGAQLDLVHQTIAELRQVLTTLKEIVDPETDRTGIELAVRTTLVRAALSPETSADLIEDLERNTGVVVDARDIPVLTIPDDAQDPDAAMAEERERLIRSLAPYWSLAEGYRRWQQSLDNQLAPLGRIDTRLARIDDLSSRIESRRSELDRRISRLTGAVPTEDTAEGDATTRRFLAGEIGALRVDRENTLREQAIQSSVSLVVIPIVALILLFVGRFFGYRFFMAMAARSSKEVTVDQKQRATTLYGIFSSGWTILIIILAAIYMLKAVNVDITPLVASLGIFGLAIAFGAQAIMKDVFSGFFMLMENQFNKGEWVVINDVLAEVEQIGLRITRIREWPTGLVHYVPNGQITSVASYNREYWRGMVFYYVPFGHDPEKPREILAKVIDTFKEEDGSWTAPVRSVYQGVGISKVDHKLGAFGYRMIIEINGVSGRPFMQMHTRVAKAFNEAGIPLATPSIVQLAHGAGHKLQGLTPDRWVDLELPPTEGEKP